MGTGGATLPPNQWDPRNEVFAWLIGFIIVFVFSYINVIPPVELIVYVCLIFVYVRLPSGWRRRTRALIAIFFFFIITGSLQYYMYLSQPNGVLGINDEAQGGLYRTPHLNFSDKEPLQRGKKYDVLVFVDRLRPAVEEFNEDLNIELPAGVKRIPVSVWLGVSGQFELLDERARVLMLKGDQARSEVIKFPVRVREGIENISNAFITAYFSYRGLPCGMVRRSVRLDSGLERSEPSRADRQPHLVDGSHRLAPEPIAGLSINDLGSKSPDLTVEIKAEPDSAGQFEVLVSAPLLRLAVRQKHWQPLGNVRHFVDSKMRSLVGQEDLTRDGVEAFQGGGRAVFDLAPKAFRDVFWAFCDSEKPLKTIYVVSDEPYVPWELMVPYRNLTNGVFEPSKEPLGVTYAVGRWMPIDNCSPLQALPLRDCFIICPKYDIDSDYPPLGAAEEEMSSVTNRLRGSVIAPAESHHLDDFLLSNDASLLHFIGHGSDADEDGLQALYLDHAAVLDSDRIASLEGFQRFCHSRDKLIFLNACEVGRQVSSLNGASGFPRSFMVLGASGIVAPLWKVNDTVGAKFAQEFYSQVSTNRTDSFATIVQRIRSRAFNDGKGGGKSAFLYYCFYGDPSASQDVSRALSRR